MTRSVGLGELESRPGPDTRTTGELTMKLRGIVATIALVTIIVPSCNADGTDLPETASEPVSENIGQVSQALVECCDGWQTYNCNNTIVCHYCAGFYCWDESKCTNVTEYENCYQC